MLENALELKITGIIRPKEDAQNAGITTAAAYTSKLTDYVITHTDESAIILAQEADAGINVLTGMKFESSDDDAKANDAKAYLSALSISDKASFYKLMTYLYPTILKQKVREQVKTAWLQAIRQRMSQLWQPRLTSGLPVSLTGRSC